MYSSANKSNPKVLNSDRKIKTRRHQPEETAGNKSVRQRKEGEAGINTQGKSRTDWQQVQHMRGDQDPGKEGTGSSTRILPFIRKAQHIFVM